jgi:hypothetical protein
MFMRLVPHFRAILSNGDCIPRVTGFRRIIANPRHLSWSAPSHGAERGCRPDKATRPARVACHESDVRCAVNRPWQAAYHTVGQEFPGQYHARLRAVEAKRQANLSTSEPQCRMDSWMLAASALPRNAVPSLRMSHMARSWRAHVEWSRGRTSKDTSRSRATGAP